MDGLRLPDYTLRFHKSSVTDLLVVDLPKEVAPILVSGDATGKLCLWDVITRRPKFIHCIENAPQIVALQYVEDGLLAVLDKHHKLRLFKIDGSWEQLNEIPVNTLNFANFLVQRLDLSRYRLICCNTQDSETIDVYEFQLSELRSLKRIHKGLNFYQAICSSVLPHGFKLEKLGIVMKFAELRGTIYCGMESGFIIGFQFNESYQVQIVYVSHVHYPNPVLDLFSCQDCLLSSSIDDKIGFHEFVQRKNDENLEHYGSLSVREGQQSLTENYKKVPLTKIGHLRKLENLLLLTNWAGETVITNEQTEVISKFVKSKSNVEVNENPQGNLQGNKPSVKNTNLNCKISSLEGVSRFNANNSNSAVSTNMGQRRRIQKFSENSWCIIGYEDGNISFHRL